MCFIYCFKDQWDRKLLEGRIEDRSGNKLRSSQTMKVATVKPLQKKRVKMRFIFLCNTIKHIDVAILWC